MVIWTVFLSRIDFVLRGVRTMKKTSRNLLVLFILAEALVACDRLSETVSGSLARLTGHEKEANEALTNLNTKKSAMDDVVVSRAEWDDYQVKRRSCAAELSDLKSKSSILLKAEYAKGEVSCLEMAEKERAQAMTELVREVEDLLDKVKHEWSVLKMPAAIVNGECEATIVSGEKFHYVLKNVCVNVNKKLVGNDGDVSGIVNANSTAAQAKGIVALTCYVGQAHIALIPEKCDTAEGIGHMSDYSIKKSAGGQTGEEAKTGAAK